MPLSSLLSLKYSDGSDRWVRPDPDEHLAKVLAFEEIGIAHKYLPLVRFEEQHLSELKVALAWHADGAAFTGNFPDSVRWQRGD